MGIVRTAPWQTSGHAQCMQVAYAMDRTGRVTWDMRAVSRRRVLKLAGACAAAIALRPRRSFGEESILPEVTVLPTHQPRPDVVQAWLVARDVAASVAGTRAILKTYNGSFPGPVLRLHEGDRVQLALTNQLAKPTNLHLHGLRVSASIDDPFLSVAPGKSVVYEFTVPPGSAGTHWYHPHLHERVARQLFAGLAGPIVVTGAIDELPELKVADDRLLVLKDLSLAGDRPAPHTAADWVLGKEG